LLSGDNMLQILSNGPAFPHPALLSPLAEEEPSSSFTTNRSLSCQPLVPVTGLVAILPTSSHRLASPSTRAACRGVPAARGPSWRPLRCLAWTCRRTTLPASRSRPRAAQSSSRLETPVLFC